MDKQSNKVQTQLAIFDSVKQWKGHCLSWLLFARENDINPLPVAMDCCATNYTNYNDRKRNVRNTVRLIPWPRGYFLHIYNQKENFHWPICCLACAWNLGHHRLSTWWITKFTYGLHGFPPPAPCWRIRKDTWRPDAPVPTTYSTWWWNVIDLVFKKLFDCFTKTVKEWEKKKRMTPNRKRKMAWG